MQRIEVRPFDDRSWQVTVAGVENPLVFRSGARAETAARALAHRLAGEGQASELTITMRDGWVAARVVTSPPLARGLRPGAGPH